MSDARQRINMTDSDIVAHFARIGYRVLAAQIAFVGETVDDFREARSKKWYKAGRVKHNEPGLYIVEECQPRPGQRTRDIVVVSFGSSRAVMGVEIKPGAPPLKPGDATCRYAPTMEWAKPEAPKGSIPKGKVVQRA